MASLLDAREWDYVVGSVHFIAEYAVDHRGWDIWQSTTDADKVWRRYFETLGEAARTGMFDILAHPDLVKVWGRESPLPDGDLRRFYEIAMDGIAETRRRSRSPRPACASPSASCTPTRRSWRCALTPAAPWRCPRTRICPSIWATATTRRWSCSRAWA